MDLSVGHTVAGQVLRLDSADVGRYSLTGLQARKRERERVPSPANASRAQPNASYEVRVAYPGTVPVLVTLQFEPAGASAGRGSRRVAEATPPCTHYLRWPLPHSRRLLDVEKLVFRTDAAGRPAGAGVGGALVVAVRATLGGLYTPGSALGPRLVVYDVSLSRLVHGLPEDALQLLPWLAGCLAFALLAAFTTPLIPVSGRRTARPCTRRVVPS